MLNLRSRGESPEVTRSAVNQQMPSNFAETQQTSRNHAGDLQISGFGDGFPEQNMAPVPMLTPGSYAGNPQSSSGNVGLPPKDFEFSEGQNTYRMSSKKKTYAQIPGLSSGQFESVINQQKQPGFTVNQPPAAYPPMSKTGDNNYHGKIPSLPGYEAHPAVFTPSGFNEGFTATHFDTKMENTLLKPTESHQIYQQTPLPRITADKIDVKSTTLSPESEKPEAVTSIPMFSTTNILNPTEVCFKPKPTEHTTAPHVAMFSPTEAVSSQLYSSSSPNTQPATSGIIPPMPTGTVSQITNPLSSTSQSNLSSISSVSTITSVPLTATPPPRALPVGPLPPSFMTMSTTTSSVSMEGNMPHMGTKPPFVSALPTQSETSIGMPLLGQCPSNLPPIGVLPTSRVPTVEQQTRPPVAVMPPPTIPSVSNLTPINSAHIPPPTSGYSYTEKRTLLPPSVARRVSAQATKNPSFIEASIFVPKPSDFCENEYLVQPPANFCNNSAQILEAPSNFTLNSETNSPSPAVFAPSIESSDLDFSNYAQSVGAKFPILNSQEISQSVPKTEETMQSTFFNPSTFSGIQNPQNIDLSVTNISANQQNKPFTQQNVQALQQHVSMTQQYPPILQQQPDNLPGTEHKESPVHQNIPTYQQDPPITHQNKPFMHLEEPKKAIEPPKTVPTSNFRMSKQRPKYYSGPIEGVSNFDSGFKPTLEPVLPTTPIDASLFTPQGNSHESVGNENKPFDLNISRVNRSVDKTEFPHTENTQFATGFDLSRPTEKGEIIEPKGAAIFGSLKSKLSSINIDKIQSKVTSFFDPNYYEKSQESNSEFSGQLQNSNLEVFVPAANQQEYDQNFYGYVQQKYTSDPYSGQQSTQKNFDWQTQQHHALYEKQDFNTEYYTQTQNTRENIMTQDNNAIPNDFNTIPKENYTITQDYNTQESFQAPTFYNPQSYQTTVDHNAHHNVFNVATDNYQHNTFFYDPTAQNTSSVSQQQEMANDSGAISTNYDAELKYDKSAEVLNNANFQLKEKTSVLKNDDSFIRDDFVTTNDDTSESKQPIVSEILENVLTNKVKGNIKSVEDSKSFFNKITDEQEIDKKMAKLSQDVNAFFGADDTDKDNQTISFMNPINFTQYQPFSMHHEEQISEETAGVQKTKENDNFEKGNMYSVSKKVYDELKKSYGNLANLDTEESFNNSPLKAQTKEFSDIFSDEKNVNVNTTSMDAPKPTHALDENVKNIGFKQTKHEIKTKIDEFSEKSQQSFEFKAIGDRTDDFNDNGVELQQTDDVEGELDICETCREVNKHEGEATNLTSQLIENMTSPVQLFNPVEAPFFETTASSIDNDSTPFDSEQCAEISQVAEETIETIQVQSSTEFFDEKDLKEFENDRNFVWKAESPKNSVREPKIFLKGYEYGLNLNVANVAAFENIIPALLEHDYVVKSSVREPIAFKKNDKFVNITDIQNTTFLQQEYDFKPDVNAIGFQIDDLTLDDGLLRNASDEIKAGLINVSPELIITRQMSVPTAPQIEEFSDVDEEQKLIQETQFDSNSIDVQLIEQDAKRDFDFDEFVIEPSETDDDKIECIEREKSYEEPFFEGSCQIDKDTHSLTEFAASNFANEKQNVTKDADLTTAVSQSSIEVPYFDITQIKGSKKGHDLTTAVSETEVNEENNSFLTCRMPHIDIAPRKTDENIIKVINQTVTSPSLSIDDSYFDTSNYTVENYFRDSQPSIVPIDLSNTDIGKNPDIRFTQNYEDVNPKTDVVDSIMKSQQIGQTIANTQFQNNPLEINTKTEKSPVNSFSRTINVATNSETMKTQQPDPNCELFYNTSTNFMQNVAEHIVNKDIPIESKRNDDNVNLIANPISQSQEGADTVRNPVDKTPQNKAYTSIFSAVNVATSSINYLNTPDNVHLTQNIAENPHNKEVSIDTGLNSEPAPASFFPMDSPQIIANRPINKPQEVPQILPDPMLFFSTSIPEQKQPESEASFNLLASYFGPPSQSEEKKVIPQRSDPAKPFFELSQAQGHYKFEENESLPATKENVMKYITDKAEYTDPPKPFFELSQAQDHYKFDNSKNITENNVVSEKNGFNVKRSDPPKSFFELSMAQDHYKFEKKYKVTGIKVVNDNVTTKNPNPARKFKSVDPFLKLSLARENYAFDQNLRTYICSSSDVIFEQVVQKHFNSVPNTKNINQFENVNKSSNNISCDHLNKENNTFNTLKSNDDSIKQTVYELIQSQNHNKVSKKYKNDKKSFPKSNLTNAPSKDYINNIDFNFKLINNKTNNNYNKNIDADFDIEVILDETGDINRETSSEIEETFLDYFIFFTIIRNCNHCCKILHLKRKILDSEKKIPNLNLIKENDIVFASLEKQLEIVASKQINDDSIEKSCSDLAQNVFNEESNVLNSKLNLSIYNDISQIDNQNHSEKIGFIESKKVKRNDNIDEKIVKPFLEMEGNRNISLMETSIIEETDADTDGSVSTRNSGFEINSNTQHRGACNATKQKDEIEKHNDDEANEEKKNDDLHSGGRSAYTPVEHHWFYRVEVEGRSSWRPFSNVDSQNLEEAFVSPDLNESTVVATDGGRFDVKMMERLRYPVYWVDKPTNVRRCSWFYKGATDIRYIPYSEATADILEAEYRRGVTTGQWHRKVNLDHGESVVLHGPQVMVHFMPGSNPDAWPQGPQSVMRPRVVKRNSSSEEMAGVQEGEPTKIDHLLLLCHGIGSACDLKFRGIEEVVSDFRAISYQLLRSHYKKSCESGDIGRVEVLPISWHDPVHSGSTGVDERLARITLESIPKLRTFTNDTVLDVLLYTSPVYSQQIMDTVASELNRIYALFMSRNPEYSGGVSLGGHSLGSIILFDLLCNQPSKSNSAATSESLKNKGPFNITYQILDFHPKALFALGSPIAIFQCIRGVESLGEDFRLPTCPSFFNIFHPYDPVAYRIEPLINPELKNLSPLLIPHHKGRKRMHLELKDTMARVGADLRQKVFDSVKNTWASVWKSKSPQTQSEDEDHSVARLSSSASDLYEESDQRMSNVAPCIVDEPVDDNDPLLRHLGMLNRGRRIDRVLQEAPIEVINEYLFAMTSHVCYWESADTMLLILREIYESLGVSPDKVVPQQTLLIERSKSSRGSSPTSPRSSPTDRPSTSKDES